MTEGPPEADLNQIRLRIRAFAEAREWERFHTPKNLAMALAVEAAELMEPLQWLTTDEAAEVGTSDPETLAAVTDELADVAIYLVRLADVLGVELPAAIDRKLERNAERFPVDTVRGRARLPSSGRDT